MKGGNLRIEKSSMPDSGMDAILGRVLIIRSRVGIIRAVRATIAGAGDVAPHVLVGRVRLSFPVWDQASYEL